MRKSEYYGVNVPELGDRADITVVSQAIIDSENNQSGKVENMKATVGGTIISLTSETRQDALLKYYNGLAVQFISPVNASAGSSYKIKIGSLTEQPYNNKVDIKVGDIVQAIYGSTGFISANTPIPRSSSTDSNSEVTVATSNAVKQANDNANGRVSKSGDTMTNTLNIKRNGIKVINFQEADESSTQVGYVGFGSNSTPREMQLRNTIAGEMFAITESGEYQFPTKTTTSSIDANDIIPSSDKKGIIYRIAVNSHVGDNFPEGAGAGILKVWRSYNTHIVQEYYNIGGIGNPSAWYRIRSSSTNWSAWKKFITSTDIINDLTTGGADKVASGETVKTLNSTKASKNGDTFTGLIKMKMARPYIEFLNTSNERMGYIGYGATDNTKLQIINALKSNESVSNTLEVYNDGSLAIPYETIPNNSVVDANDLIPSQDVGTKIYRISSSSVVTNSSNFPEGAGAGILKVTRTYNTQITQEYFDTTSNNTYIRYKVSAWYPWVSVDKKHYTIMFAKGTGDSSDIVQSSDSEVTLDIFQHRQFGDGNLAQYDPTDKTIKILKSGRYMINMAIYHVGTTGRNSFIFRLYKNDTLIDYTESRGSDIREKKNINLVYDLKANEKLKLTVRNSVGDNLTIYTPREYSRLQLTKISEIGGL
jgi:hypothetical protein